MTANNAQANTPANTATDTVPISLDAAAFAATSTPPAAAPAADAASTAAPATTNAAEDALKKALDAETQAAPADAATDGEASVKTMGKMSTAEIEKLLAGEEPAAAAPAAAEPANPDDAIGADGKHAPVMIPKPRLDEALEKGKVANTELTNVSKKLEETTAALAKEAEEKAYYKGLAEGVSKAIPPEGYTSTGGKATVDPLVEIQEDLKTLNKDKRDAMLDLAKQYDEGSMTMTQFEERKATIEGNAKAIEANIHKRRDAVVKEQSTPTFEDSAKAVNADPRLKIATDKLFADNPWLGSIPPAGMATLVALATKAMVEKGIPNVPTVESTWQLRQHMMLVGKSLGMDKIAVAATKPADTTQASPAGAKTQPTPEQRLDKLDLAAALPPAPTLGAAANLPTDALSAIDYKTVGVRELSKILPKDTYRKLLEQ